jgi:dTDP-4-amino-4,6-dideoxygalactose transaminase
VQVLDATSSDARNSHYCLSLVFDAARRSKRDQIVAALNARGVGTSVYYPHPVPRLRYYQSKYGYDPGQFPHAAAISDGSIALPVSWHLSDDDVRHIEHSVKEVLEERL